MLTYAEDLERMQNANEIKTLKARSKGTQIAVYQKQHLSHCLFGIKTQENTRKVGGVWGWGSALFMLCEIDSAFQYRSVWSFLYLHLNGVFDGSYRALCLSRAGPGASSWRGVEMYLGGGPPKICSLFCSTCSQRCSVFNAAWQRGEQTGRSETELQMYKKWGRGDDIRVCVGSIYPIDHILPLGRTISGWPTPAEPLPNASNTNCVKK